MTEGDFDIDAVDHAHLVVLKPELVVRDFEASDPIQKYKDEYSALRRALTAFRHNDQQGISLVCLCGDHIDTTF